MNILHEQTWPIENMLQPFDPVISLVLNRCSLLEKVVSGEYIISNITENYFVNSTETEVTFEYTIEFFKSETAYITLIQQYLLMKRRWIIINDLSIIKETELLDFFFIIECKNLKYIIL